MEGGGGKLQKQNLGRAGGAPPPNLWCALDTGRLPNARHWISGSESAKPDPFVIILLSGGEVKPSEGRAGGTYVVSDDASNLNRPSYSRLSPEDNTSRISRVDPQLVGCVGNRAAGAAAS